MKYNEKKHGIMLHYIYVYIIYYIYNLWKIFYKMVEKWKENKKIKEDLFKEKTIYFQSSTKSKRICI